VRDVQKLAADAEAELLQRGRVGLGLGTAEFFQRLRDKLVVADVVVNFASVVLQVVPTLGDPALDGTLDFPGQ
jgi:hypothetical protein